MAITDNAKHAAKMTGVVEDLIPITAGASALSDTPEEGTPIGLLLAITHRPAVTYVARGLWCSCTGVATVKMTNGRTRTGIPLQAGPNPGPRVTHVTAWTPDTALGTIWGIK